jgi:hypothetical protein
MSDQVIDAVMARALHADACRDHALVAWIVMWDASGCPNRFIARLAPSNFSTQPYWTSVSNLRRNSSGDHPFK